MNKLGMLAGLAVVTMLVAGCAGSKETKIVQQTTMYSTMDSTALVYTDPAAASAIQDHPLRWAAFVIHPFGVVGDYLVNRPLYFIASLAPGIFGYTSEDAMISEQRVSAFR
jgi:hypothetical protein